MRKGKRNDELAYFCSGIPVTRARAQEIKSSPIREDPLQMPSSPIILRSGKVLRSPKPSKVDPREDPVCQLLNEILHKHRKTPPQEETLDLQQILKPISARASTSADINAIWPSSALLATSITSDAQQQRIPPTKTGSSTFQIDGQSTETAICANPKEPQTPERSRFSIFGFSKPSGPPLEKPSPPRVYSPGVKPTISSTTQQVTRSARIIQACSSLMSDVLARVESAIGVSPKPKSAVVVQKTPPQTDRNLKEKTQTNPANAVSKSVKYVDKGTSPIDLIDSTPPEIEGPTGDPGFRFKSVESTRSTPCTVDLPRNIKTGPFTGWEDDPSPRRGPIRTGSFRPKIAPSTPQRRRAISMPCSIL